MKEFEELLAVRRIHFLLNERGRERTPEQIRRHAKTLHKVHKCAYRSAYDYIEADLLSSSPSPEDWS